MALDPEAALAAIRAKTKTAPAVAIVLGSGLGRLADEVTAATRIPYADIPGWERSTAPGHSGELVVGMLAGKPVAVMRGRLHYYEGYDMASIAFPVRVFKAWGVDTVILGCTHYPLIRPLLRRVVPLSVEIVDSAESTSAKVVELLGASGAQGASGDLRCYATDSVEKFRRLGSKFLGCPIEKIELVDIEK